MTCADKLTDLYANVRDAVACHFEPMEKPSIIRLHPTSLKIDLEKIQLLLEQKDKEINLLQQQINDLREMIHLLKMQVGGFVT